MFAIVSCNRVVPPWSFRFPRLHGCLLMDQVLGQNSVIQEEGADEAAAQLSRRHEIAFGIFANLLSHGQEVLPYLVAGGGEEGR